MIARRVLVLIGFTYLLSTPSHAGGTCKLLNSTECTVLAICEQAGGTATQCACAWGVYSVNVSSRIWRCCPSYFDLRETAYSGLRCSKNLARIFLSSCRHPQ